MQLPLAQHGRHACSSERWRLGQCGAGRHMAARPGLREPGWAGFERKVCGAGSLLRWLSEASGPACAVQGHVSCLVVAAL